jgi:hypothetical protein
MPVPLQCVKLRKLPSTALARHVLHPGARSAAPAALPVDNAFVPAIATTLPRAFGY